MLPHNIEPTLDFHAEDMINPQLMTLGLCRGAEVALADKGTAGAPCRSAVLFAGVEADLAKMVVSCPERGLNAPGLRDLQLMRGHGDAPTT